MALTWVYAVSGKNAWRASRAWPVTTAAHRPVISAWNTRRCALGNARVWGRRPGGGGTGRTAGERRGRAVVAVLAGLAGTARPGAAAVTVRCWLAAAGRLACPAHPAAARLTAASSSSRGAVTVGSAIFTR